MARFVLVLDTPGIKQFVFGTDALAEVRGASALLDRLNRNDTPEILGKLLSEQGGRLDKVFANGGAAQFLVEASDRASVLAAADGLAAYYAEQTGGEARLLAAVAAWEPDQPYETAVQMAHLELQLRRHRGLARPSIPILPLVQECESTSHLPARGIVNWGSERLLLSDASRLKREESVAARRGMLWTGWIETLNLPGDAANLARRLRPKDTMAIGAKAARKGYIGLVYADGNAMGRLVQELDSPDVCRAFSELVDGSLRDACYQALSHVLDKYLNTLRCSPSEPEPPDEQEPVADNGGPLPADILLLGGDDLLVVLPADRALEFALKVSDTFTNLTKDRQAKLPAPAREFFARRGLLDRGLTISCGVAIGPARYPFYLLLDLAEELLQSAKAAGSRDDQRTDYWAPSYIDFHQLAGSESPELGVIRSEDYHVGTDQPRTLRPYRNDRLSRLRDAARRLQEASIPGSKLHDLFEAALEPRPVLAELRARELFGRLKQDPNHPEREALWDSLSILDSVSPYPWTTAVQHVDKASVRATALADLIEAYELFSSEEDA
ncbi:MAG: hypothetical protein K6T86_06445 [Pirellulales bacterium]|nr:hypothetical protein [Pirellulales bacterium]